MYLKKAQSEKPCLYEILYDKFDPANRLVLDMEKTLTLEKESRSKLNKDKVRPYDYTKLNSLYENFKPAKQEYHEQLAHANEVRKKMCRKSFVKSKPKFFKNISFLPVSKSISESRQAYNVMTNNINHFKELVDQAWEKHSHDLFRTPTSHDMEVLIKTCLMPLALKTQNYSFTFVHELKQEMHDDLKKTDSFSDSLERKSFSKTKSVPKNYVSEGLSKPVTTQILPQTARQAVRNTNVIKPGMYRIDTRTTQTRAPQLPQTYRNTNPHVSTSTGVIHKTNVSIPQLKKTQMKDNIVPNTKTTSSTPICFMAKASPTQAWLWHRRLSHLNFEYINLLSKKDVVIGLAKLKYVKDQLSATTAPSQKELDLLFGPLYDKFFNSSTSSVNKSSSPTNNSKQQDTPPTMNNLSSTKPTTLTTNVHAEENNDNQAEDTHIQQAKFINPICTSVRKLAESSSCNIDNSNMHTFYQPDDIK
ncbi:gag-pol polyprotein [Tanacetum coccineum]